MTIDSALRTAYHHSTRYMMDGAVVLTWTEDRVRLDTLETVPVTSTLTLNRDGVMAINYGTFAMQIDLPTELVEQSYIGPPIGGGPFGVIISGLLQVSTLTSSNFRTFNHRFAVNSDVAWLTYDYANFPSSVMMQRRNGGRRGRLPVF